MRYKSLVAIIGMIIFLIGLLSSTNVFKGINPLSLPSSSPQSQLSTPSAENSTTLGVATKSSQCVSENALPDKACTPGAVLSNVTKDQVCTPGYSKSVRNVPESVKTEVYTEYGITSHSPGEYEVDHLISLELGGSNDITNLWPEPAEPRPGYHEKDKVENYLHDQVCSGQISLQQSQQEISNNWISVYNQINP